MYVVAHSQSKIMNCLNWTDLELCMTVRDLWIIANEREDMSNRQYTLHCLDVDDSILPQREKTI